MFYKLLFIECVPFTVFENGVSEGVKAFFNATYNVKNGLKINVEQVQKPESW